jgi:hypothetical protein
MVKLVRLEIDGISDLYRENYAVRILTTLVDITYQTRVKRINDSLTLTEPDVNEAFRAALEKKAPSDANAYLAGNTHEIGSWSTGLEKGVKRFSTPVSFLRIGIEYPKKKRM